MAPTLTMKVFELENQRKFLFHKERNELILLSDFAKVRPGEDSVGGDRDSRGVVISKVVLAIWFVLVNEFDKRSKWHLFNGHFTSCEFF